MIWDYRVIETRDYADKKYSVHTCYYDNEESQSPSHVSEKPVTLTGRGLLGMLTDMELVLEAFKKPTIRIVELDRR